MRLSRRALLAGAVAALAASRRLPAQEPGPLAGEGPTGTLGDPNAAGLPRDRSTARDNDPFIYDVEHRIKCQCGCNLDVYTCRTTDFTCQTSPAMHREVLALQDQGKSAQEITEAFVAEYGEKALMAPKPQGFNLAGYLVPGALIALAGTILTVYLLRRGRVAAAATPLAVIGPAAAVPGSSFDLPPTADELERLRRAIAEPED